MDLPFHEPPADPRAQRRADGARAWRAFNASLGFVLLLLVVFALGLLRRDRAAIAAGMVAFMFYGGMLLTVLPREPGISWQAHLGGALAGLLAAWLFRRSDPVAPRKRYSWEIEEELAAERARESDQFEPPPPEAVPVLWNRDASGEGGNVLPFRPRRD